MLAPLRKVLTSCWIIVLYIIMRMFVYRVVPNTDFASWVVQDTVMDIPRALAGALSLWFGLRWFGKERLGLFWKKWQIPAALCVCFCFNSYIFGLDRTPFDLQDNHLAILTASSFVVAFFEEAMFRGVLFQSLEDWKGKLVAVAGSTVIFTAFHYGAQAWWSFPHILIVSIILGLARGMGCSLYALMLTHAIYDSLIFVLQGRGMPDYGFTYWRWLGLFVLMLVVVAGLYYKKMSGKALEQN